MSRLRLTGLVLAIASGLSLSQPADVQTQDERRSTTALACNPPFAIGPISGSPHLRGDVDGDRLPDSVFLSENPEGASQCRYFLVVATRGKHLVAAINRPWFARSRTETVLRQLSLESLIQLERSGLDIVVNVDRGASWNEIEIYTVTNSGKQERVLRRVSRSRTFRFGGTVRQFGVIDCAGRGSSLILVSEAVRNAGGWRVSRHVYRILKNHASQPVSRLSAITQVRRYEEIAARFPEFADGTKAFRSCSV